MGAPLSAKYSLELGFSFNTRLGTNLEKLRYMVLNQNADCVIVVDGYEGLAGKSMFAQQLAYYLDIDTFRDTGEKQTGGEPILEPTGQALKPEQVVLDFESFKDRVRRLPPFKAIIFDEAQIVTDRREFGSEAVKRFNTFMRECRHYRKFIIIVVQRFYDCDFYIATGRGMALLHGRPSFPDDSDPRTPLSRGVWRWYNKKGMETLYTNDLYRKQYVYKFLGDGRCFDFDIGNKAHWVIPYEEYYAIKKGADDQKAKTDALKNKMKCPECHCRIRFVHKEKVWRCSSCSYSRPHG